MNDLTHAKRPQRASHLFTVESKSCLRFCGSVLIALVWLTLSASQAQTTTYALGTTTLLVGPAGGSTSVVLAVTPATASWTTTNNATWLHLSPANQSGTGSTNVVFSYDANPGATRVGALTIAGQTLTVTQAGATYVAADPPITLVSSNLLNSPRGVAVDSSCNVYIADTMNNAIKKWSVANNTVTTLVSALFQPSGVAVDGAGNVYIADTYNEAIEELTAAFDFVPYLISPGELACPYGVAVDGGGNVYFTDTFNDVIEKWTAANSNLTTLVSGGLNWPTGVAVDGAGNVYIADCNDNVIKKWTAANNTVTNLVSTGLIQPSGVAVDGAGNVYIADNGDNAIKEWMTANSNLTTLISIGLNGPCGVAVDGAGNVYFADTAIKELPHAFVDRTGNSESCAAGSDVLPVVLPPTVDLLAPFAPTSDEPWLTITGITNGVVSFTFATNSGPIRGAKITLLGQTIPIRQSSPPNFLNPTTLGDGVFQFAFSNFQNSFFTVLSTTDLFLPVTNWTIVGTASNIAPNLFQFTDTQATNSQRYYTVRSP